MLARRTETGLFVQTDGFGLNAAYKKEHLLGNEYITNEAKYAQLE
jgi:hypothetical protein